MLALDCISNLRKVLDLLSTLVQLLHYILKCNYFGMTTVSFLSKCISIPDEDLYVRRVHRFILCLNYMMFPLVLYPPSFEAVYCYICGRRMVAVARYRICLVPVALLKSTNSVVQEKFVLSHRRARCKTFVARTCTDLDSTNTLQHVSMVADLCHFVFSLFRGDITKAP